jgi:hypothetical protein
MSAEEVVVGFLVVTFAVRPAHMMKLCHRLATAASVAAAAAATVAAAATAPVETLVC